MHKSDGVAWGLNNLTSYSYHGTHCSYTASERNEYFDSPEVLEQKVDLHGSSQRGCARASTALHLP